MKHKAISRLLIGNGSAESFMTSAILKQIITLSNAALVSVVLLMSTATATSAHHHNHWHRWERQQRRLYNRDIRRAYHWQNNHHYWRPYDYGYRRNFDYDPIMPPGMEMGPNGVHINF